MWQNSKAFEELWIQWSTNYLHYININITTTEYNIDIIQAILINMGKLIEKEEIRQRKKDTSDNKNNIVGDIGSKEDDIPDEEKLRLIRETGIMDKFKNVEIVDVNKALRENKNKSMKGNDDVSSSNSNREDEEDDPFKYGYTFQAFLYTIPLCATYSMMDILVHKQYNQDFLLFWHLFLLKIIIEKYV